MVRTNMVNIKEYACELRARNTEGLTNKLVNYANFIVRNLEYKPRIIPGDNSIRLEYYGDAGKYLGFDVTEETVGVLVIDEYGEESSEENIKLLDLQRYIHEFHN